jgi:hypothetical protein
MTTATETYNVELTMTDELTSETIIRRIDKSNAMRSGSECWELGGEESQRASLERWIDERGNEQHETILTLVSWKFC